MSDKRLKPLLTPEVDAFFRKKLDLEPGPPTVTHDEVEAGARALREHRNVPGVGDPSPWEQATAVARQAYYDEACAVLAAAAKVRSGIA